MQCVYSSISDSLLCKHVQYMLTSVFVCYPVYFILLVSSSFREKGGAYGAGAKSSAGVFSFFSYRYDFKLKLI